MGYEVGFSVGMVARRLGVAPSTLRTWNRRYGIGAQALSPGRHRRYTDEDISRLEHMQKLILRGVSPGDAARAALAAGAHPTRPPVAERPGGPAGPRPWRGRPADRAARRLAHRPGPGPGRAGPGRPADERDHPGRAGQGWSRRYLAGPARSGADRAGVAGRAHRDLHRGGAPAVVGHCSARCAVRCRPAPPGSPGRPARLRTWRPAQSAALCAGRGTGRARGRRPDARRRPAVRLAGRGRPAYRPGRRLHLVADRAQRGSGGAASISGRGGPLPGCCSAARAGTGSAFRTGSAWWRRCQRR